MVLSPKTCHGSLAPDKIRSKPLAFTFKADRHLVFPKGPRAPGELARAVLPGHLVPSVSPEPLLDVPTWLIELAHLQGQAFMLGESHLRPLRQETN